MKIENLNKFGLTQNQTKIILGGLKGRATATVCEDVTQDAETGKCDTRIETSDDAGKLIADRTIAGC